MDIKTANELFKNGKYEDAENLWIKYKEIYSKNNNARNKRDVQN